MTGSEKHPTGLDAHHEGSFSRAREFTAAHSRRTSPDDPELLARIGQEGLYWAGGTHDETIFGRHALDAVDNLRESGTDAGDVLAESRTQLEKILLNGFNDKPGFIADLESSGNNWALDELEKSEESDLAAVLERLSLDQYEAFLRSHSERLQTALDQRQSEVPELQRSFLERLERRIQTGAVPITIEQARHRLGKVETVYFDSWKTSSLNGSWSTSPGDYDFATGRVRIVDPFRSQNQIQMTADHEYFHAISGTVAKIPATEKSHRQDLVIKTGVTVTSTPYGEEETRTRRSRLLNESVTEQLAIDIRANKTGTYYDGRTIFDLLSERVPKLAFYKAYFEDFDEEVGTPCWGELQRQLNERFEPRILLTLDKIIKAADTDQKASDAAANYLRELLGHSQ